MSNAPLFANMKTGEVTSHAGENDETNATGSG
ncbi:hypothetical protein I656_02193 [Geobacillus sp. WSUCF1]|nr:hypothetical protein I656_02193 [Geobacillus sp. WSUCF1]